MRAQQQLKNKQRFIIFFSFLMAFLDSKTFLLGKNLTRLKAEYEIQIQIIYMVPVSITTFKEIIL